MTKKYRDAHKKIRNCNEFDNSYSFAKISDILTFPVLMITKISKYIFNIKFLLAFNGRLFSPGLPVAVLWGFLYIAPKCFLSNISVSVRDAPIRHSGRIRSKVFSSLRVFKRELSGRSAGNG